jgi:hypothetical protein
MSRIVGGGASVFVERPMSRLSKRITWKPRSTNSSTNGSGHMTICAPRPWTNSNGSPSPITSYSSLIPLTSAAVTSAASRCARS